MPPLPITSKATHVNAVLMPNNGMRWGGLELEESSSPKAKVHSDPLDDDVSIAIALL